VAGGDDTTRPRRQGFCQIAFIYLYLRGRLKWAFYPIMLS
jgi:hypothetical protein